MRIRYSFNMSLISILLTLTLGYADQRSGPYQFISPLPGSENNSRESTIIIRHGERMDAASLSAANALRVNGSISGPVAGRLLLSSDGRTVIFQPAGEFQPGERVTVRIGDGLRSSTDAALPTYTFSFDITPFAVQPDLRDYLDELREQAPGWADSYPQIDGQRLSSGDLPAMTVDVYDSAAVGEGYIFLAVASSTPGIGYHLMILNNDGTPFFNRELLHDYSYDFKVQPNGLLSYAQFLSHHSYTGGGNVIHMVMDNSFALVDSFQMGNGYIAEAHDFQLLPNGHALLLGYYLTRFDMSQIVPGGYPNALVSGGIIQELDADKNVVFQWRSWDYYDIATYPLNSRFVTRPIISEFHLNTINLDDDGHIFIATPTWVKKINRQTGDIVWHLGGFENEFSFIGVDSATGVDYVGGHMFHRLPSGNVLLYDNGNRQGTRSSLAHEFTLDELNRSAELVWSYTPDTLIAAWHRGNAQRLPNGNTGIGWGGASGDHIPAYTEVDAAGQKIYEISFDDPTVESYRAFRFPFPDGQPAAAVTIPEVSPGSTYLFAEGDSNNTGISVRVNSFTGSGYNELTVERYGYGPAQPRFPGRAPRVLARRMILSRFNINGIDADVMFDVGEWQIRQPDSIIIYHREFEGSGLFVPLATSYNHVTGRVIANTNRFGEFVLAVPDLASIVFTPLPSDPPDAGTVNQQLPVMLRWNPVGYVNTYGLQVAADVNFSTLLVDQMNLTSALFIIDSLSANSDYYWRVRASNDAGQSGWSATRRFTTVAPFVAVTVPNSGEAWQRGLEYFIQWDDNLAEEVIVSLYEDQTLITVIDTSESSGAYLWEIPVTMPIGNDYFIRIESTDTDTLTDFSDQPFTIMDSTTGIATGEQVGTRFVLEANYPNPFNPATTIRFALPAAVRVSLEIFDISGRHIAGALRDAPLPAGWHQFVWNGTNDAGQAVGSGVYLYRLTHTPFEGDGTQRQGLSQTRKMLLVR